MSFNSDDGVIRYFKKINKCELFGEFSLRDEIYKLKIIVTGYSGIYTQINGNGEWIIMNSG